MLFTAHSLPREDQALGGALINAVGQVGRAVGLAIGTAIQVAVEANRLGTDVQEAQAASPRSSSAFLQGIRAAEWLDFAFALSGVMVVLCFFRGAGVIGAAKK